MDEIEQKLHEHAIHFSSDHAELVRRAVYGLLSSSIEDAEDDILIDPKTQDSNRQFFDTGFLAGLKSVQKGLRELESLAKKEPDDGD